jgi:hypothetical protein
MWKFRLRPRKFLEKEYMNGIFVAVKAKMERNKTHIQIIHMDWQLQRQGRTDEPGEAEYKWEEDGVLHRGPQPLRLAHFPYNNSN